MEFIKNRKNLLIITGLVLLYFLTRFIRLTDFPMLNDESIYLHWAQLIVKDSANLVIPVSEGRQPLFIWLISLFMRVFSDPLLAGRLVSVFAGLITLIGVCAVTKEVFKKNEYIFVSAVLYVVSPFALVYDRLALLDSLVTTFTIWSIYFTILFVTRLRLDIAYTLGLVIGGGIITKSNGVFNLYLLPLSFLLLDIKNKRRGKILKWGLLLLVVFITSQLVNSILTIIPQYSRILDVNQIFIIPKREFIKLPIMFILNNFLHNLTLLLSYFAEYFTIPYLLMLFAALFSKFFKKEKLLLLLYFLLPLLIFSLFARQLLPRYIYFMTVSLFPLCAYGFVITYDKLTKSKNAFIKLNDSSITKVAYTTALLIVPFVVSLHVIKDIRNAPIPKPEKIHYVATEHNFVTDSVGIINNNSEDKKVFLAVEGYIGWAPNMYQVYLNDNKNVTIKAYFPIKDKLPAEVVSAAEKMPTYLVIPRFADNTIPKDFPVTKILEEKIILNSNGSDRLYYMRMFQVLPVSGKQDN